MVSHIRFVAFLLVFSILIDFPVGAQTDSSAEEKVPFAGLDATWINGQNRQQDFPLQHKGFTGIVYVDSYYSFNFAQPRDNTQTISATVGRHNEFKVNHGILGVEGMYKNVIAKLTLQTGAMLGIIQDQDPSVVRGRNLATNDLRNIREAIAGYHFNKGYGLNVEMGIFMSYIGLESYTTQENWCYQRTMLTEYTPFYFSGARVQYYPNAKYKMEYWVMNGWQTYGKWNQAPSLGTSQVYRPNDDYYLAGNIYVGTDARERKERIRFNHDHSLVHRYRRGQTSGINQAAFSINNHLGFEAGGYQSDRFTGADKLDANGNRMRQTMRQNYFVGTSIANRIWFAKKLLALTSRVDMFANGGYYVTDNPGPYASRVAAFRESRVLRMLQGAMTLDIMPSDNFTFRVEYVRREANVPYFAGPGGTTSPTGFNDVEVPADYVPDMRRSENRVTFSANARF